MLKKLFNKWFFSDWFDLDLGYNLWQALSDWKLVQLLKSKEELKAWMEIINERIEK